jgi:y4mF family transcriptional regulator
MDKKQISTLIKKRRKQLELSQQDLAQLSGVSTRKISDIETANTTTTIDTLNKVCDILGLELVVKIKRIDL